MLLLTHFLALIYTRISLGVFMENVFLTFDKFYAKTIPKEFLNDLHEAERYHMSTVRFFILSGVVSAEFFLLDLISREITEGLAGAIVSTGIHVPIILMISGFFLRPIKICLEDKKQILFLVTLTASIAFMMWNWRLGLLSVAIVSGKQIWLDSALDFRISKIKKYLCMLISGTEPVSVISRYCIFYLSTFTMFQIVVVVFRAFNRSDSTILLCLITPGVLMLIGHLIVRTKLHDRQ